MSHVLTPPSILLSWNPTSFTTTFEAYNVYWRPARSPVMPWTKIGRNAVPPVGLTAAQVEANHNGFVVYQVGWHQDAGGQWSGGHDFAVTVETTDGLESIFGSLLTATVVPAAGNPWVVCNSAPYLNSPLEAVQGVKSKSDMGQIVRRYQGRDFSVVRTPRELPGRTVDGTGQFFCVATPDQLRYLRAAEASGRQVSLCRTRGDIVSGALSVPGFDDAAGVRQQIDLSLVETSRAPDLADYNLPPGAVLNGSSQYATTPDNALLKPGTGPFTLIVAGVFPTATGKVHLSKGSVSAGTSFGIRNTSGTVMSFTVNGTNQVSLTTPTDGLAHVVGASGVSGAPAIFLDGASQATAATTWTTATSTTAFVAGADNGGASGFSALAPLHAWGYWPRALTAAEHLAAARYLLGQPGYRLPAGAAALYDVRDDRCNVGTTTLVDQSGNGLNAILVAAPVVRGYPWALSLLEKF